MTPLQIQILLHYYCTPEQYDCLTPTHDEQQESLIKAGLLLRDKQGAISTTRHGRIVVETMCESLACFL